MTKNGNSKKPWRKDNCTVITVAVEKGGAGKTTTAVNLAAGLARRGAELGLRVLLVDMDPQCTAANAIGEYQPVEAEKSLPALLNDDRGLLQPHECILPSPWNPKYLHYITSNHQAMENIREVLITKIGREYRLRKILKPLLQDYNFVIIDSSPAADLLTQNALVASTHVLVPINLDFLGLESIARTQKMIQDIRNALEGETPELIGYLGTFYRKSVAASEDSLKILQDNFGDQVFSTEVPLNAAVPDSFSAGVDVYTYDRYSSSAKAYEKVVSEVLNRV